MTPTDSAEPLEPDYRRTAERPAFTDLPRAVREHLAGLARGAVAVAEPPVTSGFTRAYAGRLLLADGRTVFAKAADPTAPHARVAIERESAVLARLDGLATAPRLVGAGAVDEWRLVVMEAVDGDMPGMPWGLAAAEAAHQACLGAAAVPTEVAAQVTDDRLADQLGIDPTAVLALQPLAAGTDPWPAWLPALAPAQRSELAALARCAGSALAGDRVVHGDLRPDNLVVDRSGRARMVDWNWVSLGPAWVDFVGLWPLMAHHGLDVGRWLGSPLLEGVGADEVDAFLAAVTGLMVDRSRGDDSTPSLALLRTHQRFTAHVFLGLLRTRRAWA